MIGSLVVELDENYLGAWLPLTIGGQHREELDLAPVLGDKLQVLLVADSQRLRACPYHVAFLLALNRQLHGVHPEDLLVSRNEHLFALAGAGVYGVQPERALEASGLGRLQLEVSALEQVILV